VGRQATVSVAAVVVGATASVLTNLVVSGWPVVLVVALAALIVVAAVLEVIRTRFADRPGVPGAARTSLRAKASGSASVVQVGGDVTVSPPQDGTAPRA
jgi:type III secretory pathway component EscV